MYGVNLILPHVCFAFYSTNMWQKQTYNNHCRKAVLFPTTIYLTKFTKEYKHFSVK